MIIAGIALMAVSILPGLPGSTGAGSETTPADAIRAARAGFNKAIAEGDLAAIKMILAENTVLVAGTDSSVIAGRADQLAVWSQDFADPARLVYVRTPDKVTLSPTHPLAMESGSWRGAPAGSDQDFIGGTYSAKWRRIDGRWQLEAEIYMTASCGGALCAD